MSPEARVLLRPTAAYRALAVTDPPYERAGEVWTTLRRPLATALGIGAFVSWTASGHLVPALALDGAVVWSVLPALQLLYILLVVRLGAPRRLTPRLTTARVVDLFFVGNGPFLLWLLAIAGSVLFLPTPTPTTWVPIPWSPLVTMTIGAVLWSGRTTFGFLRGALDVRRGRAAGLTLAYSLLLWGTVVGYLVAVETLQLFRLRSR